MIKYGEINFVKIRDVKTPERDSTNSGIDFFIPNDIKDLFKAERLLYTPTEYIADTKQIALKHGNFKNDEIIIPAGYGLLIPSGIKMQLPLGNESYTFDLVLEDKSGICTKLGLINGAKVIDNNYRGEIHFHMINTTQFDISIKPGQKITQGIMRVVYFGELNEVEKLNETNRGDKGFGSTGI